MNPSLIGLSSRCSASLPPSDPCLLGRFYTLHQDFCDNPEEIQGDLRRARLAPAVVEWGLPSTEWTFVVDAAGIVSARFESFATLEEIEEALLKVP